LNSTARFLPARLVRLVIVLLLAATGQLRAAEARPARQPTIFVCGDSTSKNSTPLQGWGTPIASYFNPANVTISNEGHGGRSSRTYFDGDWPIVLPKIKPGDSMLIVFGINDGTTLNGIGDETREVAGQTEHTYGWYMAKMATDAREKGAHVYLLTVTPRDIWTNPKAKFKDAEIVSQEPGYNPAADKIERGTGGGKYTEWTNEVGKNLHLPVLDLTNLLADKYEKTGREKVLLNYKDHNHTFPAGADIVAASIVSGLKAFKSSPFLPLLSDKGRAVETADAKYLSENAAPVR
jgi:rhamnogalacturonan acetylesterase